MDQMLEHELLAGTVVPHHRVLMAPSSPLITAYISGSDLTIQ